MNIFRKVLNKVAVSLSLTALMSTSVHAQAYGQGSFNGTTYSSGLVTIGPVVLPVTGPQLLGILSAAAIGMAVGMVVWMRQRRRQSAG